MEDWTEHIKKREKVLESLRAKWSSSLEIIIEKDVPIPMRDGLKLAADIYRPKKPGKYPVIMTFTAYGKDWFWSERHPGWKMGYEPWSPTNTGSITFEAPDPAFWVPYGYVVIIVDARGFGRSPGTPVAKIPLGFDDILRRGMWARDMYDAIEWGAMQEWSNGNVGLSGVSLLAFSQYRVAALHPPHLKAINPWEGFTDYYRDIAAPGGVEEIRFSDPSGRIASLVAPHNPAWPPPENESPPEPDPREEDEFLSQITVPTLICATWSDHGCHTRGAFRAWRKISSRYKWLYIHGRAKWAEYYSTEARMFQKMFFDCFLKGTDDRILRIPRVRMEVRETLDRYYVRWEDDFPIPRTRYVKLYLDASDGKLKFEKSYKESKASYDSAGGKATFDFKFGQDTELIGYMSLKLWVSPEETDDMDLFITIRKLDVSGKEVYFDGTTPSPLKYPVAFGWLRLSHREIDEEKSTPWEPYLKHVVGPGQKVKPGEIVSCQIPILPSGTLFRKNETLRLEVAGTYRGGEDLSDTIVPFEYKTVNKGKHTIYTGGKYDSYLLIPLVT